VEVSSQLYATAAFLPGKEPPVHIGYGAGWTPEPVWTKRRRGEKIPGCFPESRRITLSISSLVYKMRAFTCLCVCIVSRLLFWSKNVKGRYYDDLGVAGRIVLEWILGKMWTRFIW